MARRSGRRKTKTPRGYSTRNVNPPKNSSPIGFCLLQLALRLLTQVLWALLPVMLHDLPILEGVLKEVLKSLREIFFPDKKQ